MQGKGARGRYESGRGREKPGRARDPGVQREGRKTREIKRKRPLRPSDVREQGKGGEHEEERGLNMWEPERWRKWWRGGRWEGFSKKIDG